MHVSACCCVPLSFVAHTHTHPPSSAPMITCRGYLEVMLDRVFGQSALHLNTKLQVAAASGARCCVAFALPLLHVA